MVARRERETRDDKRIGAASSSLRLRRAAQPRVLSPDQIRQRAIAFEDRRIAVVEDLAEGLDCFQKAGFATVIWADQDGKVAEFDRDIAQAFVILDMNALEHRLTRFAGNARIEFVTKYNPRTSRSSLTTGKQSGHSADEPR